MNFDNNNYIFYYTQPNVPKGTPFGTVDENVREDL